jgi:hypothetical protein
VCIVGYAVSTSQDRSLSGVYLFGVCLQSAAGPRELAKKPARLLGPEELLGQASAENNAASFVEPLEDRREVRMRSAG